MVSAYAWTRQIPSTIFPFFFNIPAGIVKSAKIGCSCDAEPGTTTTIGTTTTFGTTTTAATTTTTTPDPIGRIQFEECAAGEKSHALDIVLWSPDILNGTPPLILKKGSSYTMFLSFRASTDVTSLTPKIFMEINGVQIPGLINPDVCSLLTQNTCPFRAGQTYTYKNTFMIQSSYPAVPQIAIWKLQLPNSRNEVCFRVPIVIVTK